MGLSNQDYQALSKEIQNQKGGQPLDLDDPVVDAEIFERGMKKQFGDLKKNFREVVDNLRTNDYNTFVRINQSKA